MTSAQKTIELILIRQFAEYLTAPIFIVDAEGTLIYYNEPAEQILGLRFSETGEMKPDEWSRIFTPSDKKGRKIPAKNLPLYTSFEKREPAHSDLYIRSLKGVSKHIEVFAFPIIAQGERFLGAVAIFWELKK